MRKFGEFSGIGVAYGAEEATRDLAGEQMGGVRLAHQAEADDAESEVFHGEVMGRRSMRTMSSRMTEYRLSAWLAFSAASR